jgi:sarcosine oxidase subunit alpha
VIVTTNDDGWAVAADLLSAGAKIEGIVDERKREACHSPHVDKVAASAPIFWERTIVRANGPGSVRRALIAHISAQGNADGNSIQKIACDLIVLSTGWTGRRICIRPGQSHLRREPRGDIARALAQEHLRGGPRRRDAHH